MGHRASHVLVADGKTQIFFSRFGAMHIAELLLAGPEKTLNFVRQMTPYDVLLDDTWGEGGTLLDYDQQVLLFWTDHKIYEAYQHQMYITGLQQLWPVWTIYWADNEMADIAFALEHGTQAWQARHASEARNLPPNSLEETPNPTQTAEDLIATLLHSDSFDPQHLYSALTQNGEQIQVGTGFFDPAQPDTSDEERAAILRRIFRPELGN